MTKGFPLIVIAFTLLSSIVFSQSLKLKREIEPKTVSIDQQNPDKNAAFYVDYKNRQNQGLQKSDGATTTLIFGNWDWPFNRWQPPIMFAYDFTGDGALDPFMVATDDEVQRVGIFGYVDDFGPNQYNVYPGIDPATGLPWRTGWNSHLVMDYNAGVTYVSIYDFLNFTTGNINNYLWAIDLLSDPSTSIQLGDSTTALESGFPRHALDGNGIFWHVVDNWEGNPVNIGASTDGGAIFTVVDSAGSNDPNFWSTEFSNDPMIGAHGNKISYITKLLRGGDLSELGYFTPDVTDPDSADGEYHWYSTDGGGSWQGEVISLDGLANITNRPDYENYMSSFNMGSFYVDPNEVTHVAQSGVNTVGIDPATGDTINVYPLLYWNDRDKNWMSLETPTVELFQFSDPLSAGNAIGPAHPVLKTDPSGQLLVCMYMLPQFTGEPGNSTINTFTDPNETDFYYKDIWYTYSEDAGMTWSQPAVALSVTDEWNGWAYIGAVEVNSGTATVHFTAYYDLIPGSNVVGQNSASVGEWRYYTLDFMTVVSVDDDVAVISDFQLEQNYPNPFNPSTNIKYTLSERSVVSLKVYDVLGNEVATLVNSSQEAGAYDVNFNAANLASGLYLYTLKAGNFASTKKMMLLK